MNTLAAILLGAAAGLLAEALVPPRLASRSTAAARVRAILGTGRNARTNADQARERARREQISRDLKELEQRERARNTISIEQKIHQAGLTWTRFQFWRFGIAVGTGLAIPTFLATGSALASLGILVATAFIAPRWYVTRRRSKRLAAFVAEMPASLDIIIRGIRGGLPLHDCFQMIAKEGAEPARSEFRLLLDELHFGITISEAVERLAARVPVPEASFFSTAITLQQGTGGQLTESLSNLVGVLRDRKKMHDLVKSETAQIRTTGYIIGGLPVVMLLGFSVVAPAYISVIWTTETGKLLLAGLAAWIIAGILLINRLAKIDV